MWQWYCMLHSLRNSSYLLGGEVDEAEWVELVDVVSPHSAVSATGPEIDQHQGLLRDGVAGNGGGSQSHMGHCHGRRHTKPIGAHNAL